MNAPYLLHDLVLAAADRSARRTAVTFQRIHTDYGSLASSMGSFARGLAGLGLARSQRVAVYLDKRPETIVALFGTSAAGGVFVPVNPVFRPAQIAHILRDCNARILVTSPERLGGLMDELPQCPDLEHIIVTGDAPEEGPRTHGRVHTYANLLEAEGTSGHRVIDTDMAAILYTSGSTGKPKGVVLSHRNMVVGATSVAQYLENCPDDVILAALPLSFDAGLSQLTTAFHAGARVVLLNYLLPRDVLNAIAREQVTGLTAVPPLWIQLSQLPWPESISSHLRYIANTGGRMPLATLEKLRGMLPSTRPYLMYGLTEAFRATFLPPDLVDERPDSIGKAIPNAEVMVVREDGTLCAPNEPGELVQRGALVAMGYWNEPQKTAARFRPIPAGIAGRESGIVVPELAVYSGDTVRMDEEGFLYFIGRRDEMIKTSGYRVSPTEIEEVLYGTGVVGECAAFGVPHEMLGQVICVVLTPIHDLPIDVDALLGMCRERLPSYMIPAHVEVRSEALPRNANGKIDRKSLSETWVAGQDAGQR